MNNNFFDELKKSVEEGSVLLKLRHFTNFNRFPVSKHNCPRCGGPSYKDEWPPNYWQSGSYTDENKQYHHYSGGTIKHICTTCKIHFLVHHSEIDGIKEISCSNIVPLVEKDGYLLTPRDVAQEEYKAEHGEYFPESYI